MSSGLAFLLALFRYRLEKLHRPGASVSKSKAKPAIR
jgi:hypothetical protein